jgi:hypothetical protein
MQNESTHMNTFRPLLVACIALVAGSAYSFYQLAAERDVATSEAAGRQKAEARVKDLQTRYNALEERYANLQQLNAQPNGAPNGTQSSQGAQSKVAAASYSSALENSSPPFAAFGRQRPMGPRQNSNLDIVKSLKLSESDSAKVLKILTANQEKLRQAFESTNGQQPDPQAVNALRQEADQQVHDALGDAKYQEYEDYRKYMQEHQRINQLNSHLASDGGTSLSDLQQEQLFAIMKNEKNVVPAPTASQYSSRPEFMTAYDEWRSAYDRRTQEQAATVLTPEQLDGLKNLRTFPNRRPMSGN